MSITSSFPFCSSSLNFERGEKNYIFKKRGKNSLYHIIKYQKHGILRMSI
ncbi:unnamed protein product, partial [Vitis vinifera]